MLPFTPQVDHINIQHDAGSAEGYCVNGNAEQIPNWLQGRHGIYDAIILEKLHRFSKLAFLNNLNVEESLRGNGIGSSLLDDFLSEAFDKGANAIVLLADEGESQVDGFDLVAWYEGRGFVAVYETPSGPLMILYAE